MARNGGCTSRLRVAAYLYGRVTDPGNASDLARRHGAIIAFAAANRLEIGLWGADIQADDAVGRPALAALCESVRRYEIPNVLVADGESDHGSQDGVASEIAATGAQIVHVALPSQGHL